MNKENSIFMPKEAFNYKQYFEIVSNLAMEAKDINNNEFIAMNSRRLRATSINRLLHYYSTLNPEYVNQDEIKELKKLIKIIKLENWSKQAQDNPIIRASNLKVELYENVDLFSTTQQLEPRDYMGIDPYQALDSDDFSLVTALTPANYTQPPHYHKSNYELTYYSAPSKAVYSNRGEEIDLVVGEDSFVKITPNTNHTIKNESSDPARNASIKLPSALFDRGEDSNYSTSGSAELLKYADLGNGIKELDLSKINEGTKYISRVYRFEEGQQIKIYSDNKNSISYVISGNFICNSKAGNSSLSPSDVILLNTKFPSMNVKAINSGVIYQIQKI